MRTPASSSSLTFTPVGYSFPSSSARIDSPPRVVVLAISSTTASRPTSGRPRQFSVIQQNIRCSILFHLLVPGGKWHTDTGGGDGLGDALRAVVAAVEHAGRGVLRGRSGRRPRRRAPEVFNTDQGAQFTSLAFTGRVLESGAECSMDGRGRCLDNVFIERLLAVAEVRGGVPPRHRRRL